MKNNSGDVAARCGLQCVIHSIVSACFDFYVFASQFHARISHFSLPKLSTWTCNAKSNEMKLVHKAALRLSMKFAQQKG